MLDPLRAPNIAGLPRVAHGFFTRRGGVSEGGFASLNCGLGSNDDQAAVKENRARVAACLGSQDVVTAHQVHSATAVTIAAPWSTAERPRVDAIVTTTAGLAIAVLSADCAPVLFADAESGVVAAAHAGWRGAIGGVLEATLAAMERAGARRERMCVAIGPCIGQAAYEVGPEFEQEFLRHDSHNARFFKRESTDARPHFDLAGYTERRLIGAGVTNVHAQFACTYARDEDFFSYRRSVARKEPDYGRLISAIVLT
jgi:polyphenol oxidase